MREWVIGIAIAALFALPIIGAPRRAAAADYGEKTKAADTDKTGTPADKTTGKTAKGSVSGGDRRFMMRAAQDGMAEVEMARLGQEKASSDAVKQLAKRVM